MLKEALRVLSRMAVGDEGLKRIKSQEHGRRTFKLEQRGVLTGDQAWRRITSRSLSHGLSADDAIIGYYSVFRREGAQNSSRW